MHAHKNCKLCRSRTHILRPFLMNTYYQALQTCLDNDRFSLVRVRE
jgi:hypothetical protein